MKHYYRLIDLSRTEIETLLDRAAYHRDHPYSEILKNKQIVLMFLNPSLRTRASFEVAIRHMGGGVTTLGNEAIWPIEVRPGAIMNREGVEHVNEAAGVLSRYYDGIGIRSLPTWQNKENDLQDLTLTGFLDNAQVPTFNMESAMYHPCQSLGDLMTIRDLLDGFKNKRITICWTYHTNALPMSVPNSILLAACKMGMDVTLAHPPEFGLNEGIMNLGKRVAEKNGSKFTLSHDLDDALEDTEIVYAKSWGGLATYDNRENESSIRAKYSHWIIDRNAMARTRRGYFMHCLPVRRNVVATDEVLDSAASVVMPQAENRMHVQKAIMEKLYT